MLSLSDNSWDYFQIAATETLSPVTLAIVGFGSGFVILEIPVAVPEEEHALVSDALVSEQSYTVSTTITYTYDPLNRLKNADYNDGVYFHYTYDAVGNRLTEAILGGATKTYTYDAANRLTDVDGVSYTWDDNGNLLDDGVNEYAYTNNKLSSITGNNLNITFQYNGLGERVSQTVNSVTTRYTVDLNAGLSQVLADGTHTYLYGQGRIAQYRDTERELFLGDALGSVRQMVNTTGEVILAKSYEPYGEGLSSAGSGATSYGFTGEFTFAELIYLRSRFYVPETGTFLTRDSWTGTNTRPISYNAWLYAYGNPINQTDPTGLTPCDERGGEGRKYCILNDGGYIDTSHYRGGKRMGGDILSMLKDKHRQGKEDNPLSVEQPWFPKLPNFSLTYRTSLPKEGLGQNELNGIALGIFMDFQIRYETFQGIDPRCYMPVLGDIFPHCSSFSNEDLVSDYLGFIDYVEEGMNFEFIIDTLGGGEASSSPPTGYHPNNYKFTSFRMLEVDECKNLRLVQHDLPASLRLYKPIEAGTYWDVPKHYERTDLSKWY